MPPSVAPSQLPNDPAQAIKEPLGTIELGAFLDGCCTKSTQPSPRIQPKSLFIWNFPDRPFASRDCRLRVPLSVLSLSRLAARLESSTRVVESRRAPGSCPGRPKPIPGRPRTNPERPDRQFGARFWLTWNFECG